VKEPITPQDNSTEAEVQQEVPTTPESSIVSPEWNPALPLEETNPEGPIEPQVEPISGSWSDLVGRIQQKHKESSNFLSCAENALDGCLWQVALEIGETVECADYILTQNRVACEDSEIMAKAIESWDASICDDMSVGKEACVWEIITQKAKSGKDAQICSSLEGDDVISCNNTVVTELAREKIDDSICDDIISYSEGDTFEREFCEQEVQFIVEEREREAQFTAELAEQESQQAAEQEALEAQIEAEASSVN